MPPYSPGGWAIWGAILESIAFIGILGYVAFWCVYKRGKGAISDEDQGQSAAAAASQEKKRLMDESF